MAHHARVYWSPKRGRAELNFNWDVIDRGSVVHVTASEYVQENPDEHFAHDDYKRFIGDANITVANISPHGAPDDPNPGVGFVVNVDWPEPLPIVTDITVFGKPEVIEP